ncbi:hypothetical protein E2C01_078199 [Portunus trituberculatus]|uniref:Uncharacterized protein n=1 Tax=Portunus trituberculatus TaxID=210409 RepID=A0A5B7IPJ4_PORTR|nr:hypothetical protein [Portunus trituberculatus]
MAGQGHEAPISSPNYGSHGAGGGGGVKGEAPGTDTAGENRVARLLGRCLDRGRQAGRTAGRPGHPRLHLHHDRGGANLDDMRHCRIEEQQGHAGPPDVSRGDRRTLRRNKTGTKGKTGRRKWCASV